VITISGTADRHPGTGDHDHRITHFVRTMFLARGWSGRLYLLPYDPQALAALAVVGIAVLTPQEEQLAREVAYAMLGEAIEAQAAA
jgi:hypothetical protein